MGFGNFEQSDFGSLRRVNYSLGVILLSFFILLIRLWYLQVVQGDYYRSQSENNRMRTVFVSAPRGLVLDRKMRVMVKNRPAFNVELITEDTPDPEKTLSKLAEVTGLDLAVLKDRLGPSSRRRPFEPRLLLRDIDRDTLAKVSVQRYQLPGVMIGVSPTRDYVLGESSAHVLGYAREVTRDQLRSVRFSDYRQGDIVGQYGLESAWEEKLRGVSGIQRVEVNARGTRIGEQSFSPEKIGHTLILTLDSELQKTALGALQGQKGAVVAMNPKSGEILALVSAPGFDPNIFTGEMDPKIWRDISMGPDKKLNNRAVQGVYPPGSVFKIVMAAAALASGVTNPNERIFCPGYLNFSGRSYRCHKKEGHGSTDLAGALIQSCDVYFYTIGQRLGVDRIHDFSTRFGLGLPTQIELPSESRGLIPSTDWKRKYFKRKEDQIWFPGETLSVSIGQGAVTTTPIQLARAMSALVNGGYLMRPYLVSKVISNDGQGTLLESYEPKILNSLDIDPKILEIVKSGLVGVVNDPRGTGHKAKIGGLTVAGKTGTAQAISRETADSSKHLAHAYGDHAWFVSYAPAEDPQIVVSVIVENGGHGGAAAAPIARQVLETYFKDQIGKVENVASNN